MKKNFIYLFLFFMFFQIKAYSQSYIIEPDKFVYMISLSYSDFDNYMQKIGFSFREAKKLNQGRLYNYSWKSHEDPTKSYAWFEAIYRNNGKIGFNYMIESNKLFLYYKRKLPEMGFNMKAIM